MILKTFTVYDCKVEAYKTPFFMQTRGEALRAWGEIVNDRSSQFNKHPSDFTLFEIGEYDDQTAVLTSYETKINLGTANEFKTSSMELHQ